MQEQVYFIESENKIKIGISRNVHARLSQIRGHSGTKAVLLASVPGNREIEKSLHKKLVAHRISGEWFTDCPEVRSAMQLAINNFSGALVESRDERVRKELFGQVARIIWPHKTAAHLAAVGGANERTAARWLKGSHPPPASVIVAMLSEIIG